MKEEEFTELIKALNKKVHLDLFNKKLTLPQIHTIAKALGYNSTLKWIRISDSEIGFEGAQAISNALAINSTLTMIDLRNNQIGDIGAQAIGKVLNTNFTLKEIDLSYNEIGFEGAQAIGNALAINSALTMIDLRNNQIGDIGAQAIALCLETNSTLTTIHLQYNQIGEIGTNALSSMLEQNYILIELACFPERFHITHYLQRNISLLQQAWEKSIKYYKDEISKKLIKDSILQDNKIDYELINPISSKDLLMINTHLRYMRINY